MRKYIIENCCCNPSCDECYNNCEKIADCVLKRIVEKCITCNPQTSTDVRDFQLCIMDMLEIKVVEE